MPLLIIRISLLDGIWMRISRRYVGCVFAIVLSLAFCAASVPAAALDRSNGDYWTYEMSVNLGDFVVVGEMTLTVVDEDTLTVGSDSYVVDVLQYSGNISWTDDGIFGETTASMVYSGFTYELKDGLATVKDDMYIWSNITSDYGTAEVTYRTESQEVTTTSPPIGFGMTPDEMGVGDSWSETVVETTTSTEWDDEGISDTSTDSEEKTYSFSIAATEESLVTDAGTFDCLKITIMDDADDSYEVRWYCDKVGYYVKIANYDVGDSTPSVVVELKDYKYSAASQVLMILVVVGIVVVLVAIVAVVLVMKRKKRIPQQPMPPPPPTPPVQ